MNTLIKLLPTDKADIASPEKLFGYSYIDVRPIIPNLLTWLQDGHWPASQPVGIFLSTIAGNLTSEIIAILNGDDGAWKFQVLRWLIDERPLAPEIQIELARIRDSPAGDDVEEGVQEFAERLLRRHSA
jgi:hypothetical protein